MFFVHGDGAEPALPEMAAAFARAWMMELR
jgi:hypothetical protein